MSSEKMSDFFYLVLDFHFFAPGNKEEINKLQFGIIKFTWAEIRRKQNGDFFIIRYTML